MPAALSDLIAQNRRQVVVLDKAGTMKALSLVPAKAGESAAPERLAAELAKAGAVLLPGFELPETGYWNPSVVTDKDGKATVSFTLPEQSTAWSLIAKGITKETLAGEASDELVVKKDLFGQLKLPQAFTDGDEAEILASIHNSVLENGQIDVTLRTTIAGQTAEEKKTVEVKGKGIAGVAFKTELKRPELSRDEKEKAGSVAGEMMATFELTVAPHAQADGKEQKIAADVVRRSVPLLPYGMPVFATASGTATTDATAWIEPPSEMPLLGPSLQILVGPTIERSLLDIVLGPEPLCQREIGRIASAGETTTSDLLASLALQKLAAATPNAVGPQAGTLDARVQSAVGTLVASQNSDGGWSWTFQSAVDSRFDTARAVWAFSIAKKAGYQVPDDCYNKAVNYLELQMTAAAEHRLRKQGDHAARPLGGGQG